MRIAALASSGCTLGPNGPCVGDEFVRGFDFFRTPARANFRVPSFGNQRFVAVQEFFHLHDVVRQRFGRGVDGGQSAADDHDRHLQLKIRDGIGFRGAGELQGHQKIGCLAHSTG